MTKKTSLTGFTIVELLIVIVVIGILAAITIVAYSGVQNNAKAGAAKGGAIQAYTKIQAFAVDNSDTYPASPAAAGLASSSGTFYEYSVDNSASPRTFCLSTTYQGVSYRVSNTSSVPISGLCSGHTGLATLTCPTGFIVVPGSATYSTSDFCVMKYEAKNVSGVPTSQPTSTPWVSISQTSAISTAATACAGCHLISEAEWLTIAQNVLSVASNWSGGTIGNGFIYSGHNDAAPDNGLAASTDNDGYSGTGNTTGSNQRRTLTLSNGEVIWDLAGNAWEWTTGTATTGKPGSPGFAWRQWNGLSVPGSFSPNPYPVTANASASSWTATQGIGQIYSDSNDTTQKSFRRGGIWGGGNVSGIFSLHLDVNNMYSDINIGFRVAK